MSEQVSLRQRVAQAEKLASLGQFIAGIAHELSNPLQSVLGHLELMDKIFSPFFTTKPQGSGLGLAIVRKIVDAHDGRIDVTASPHGGTRFRITLPVTGNHQLFR